MGIHDLLAFLRDKAPTAFETFHQWKTNRGGATTTALRVAVDTPIFMYKFSYGVGNGQPLCRRMLVFAQQLQENGLDPIFVFDGYPLKAKQDEKDKRSRQRLRQVQLRVEKCNGPVCFPAADGTVDEFELEGCSPAPMSRPIMEDYAAVRLALEAVGISTATAQHEAEAHCVYLQQTGHVDLVITEDSDALAYLSNAMVVHWGQDDKEEVISASKACEALQLTPDQFQDFCVLLGNDFNARLKKVGPLRALQLVKHHGSLQALVQWGKQHSISADATMEIVAAMEPHILTTQEIFRTCCFERKE